MARFHFYVGLALITCCTLMLQLIQTRILSVVAWYHLAFFAISMAMFGLTAGAVWVYLRRDRFTEKRLSYDLSTFSTVFAVTTAACLAMQMSLTPIVLRSVTSLWTWGQLAIYMSVPFFFSGIVVSLALTRSPFPIGRVYGVDLLGAAVGCPGALLLLNHTDGPSAVLWVAAIAAVGALFFSASAIGSAPLVRLPFDTFPRRRKTICVILVAGAIINGRTDYGLQPLAAKGGFEGGDTYIFRDWNSFSRITVFPTRNLPPHMWGPSPRMPRHGLWIPQRHLTIDGDAGSTAYRFDSDLRDVEFLRLDVTNLAYHLPDRRRAAVIGVGAGRDMLSAAVFGLRDITGVEINPILVDLLTRKPGFADFTNITELEGAKFVADDGRSWLARTEETFDVIQMTVIDTWAATGAGAFTLSENGLYTVEAWRTFLRRLTPKGVFTVSRWYSPDDVSEAGRMLSLAVATLLDMGITEPQRHVFLAATGEIATLIVSRSPFPQSYLDTLDKAAAHYQHRVLASPTLKPDSEILGSIIAAKGRAELDRYTSNLDFDLTPPTDDRPFFFNQLPLNTPLLALKLARELGVGGDARLGGIRRGNLVATATLLILFLVSLGLVLVTIVIPLRPAIRDVGGKLVTGGTLYFLLIGIGFMMVEIGLLQRMSVFLGHPVYSLSVLLFTLILASGFGSLLSDKLTLNSRRKFATWAVSAAGYIIALPLWLPGVLLAFEGDRLMVRVAMCIATIAPAGLLMGFGFPTGMRLISLIDRTPTPWFWGVNGAAGVLASIVAVACSMAMGISFTLTIGAICYILLIPSTFAFIWPRDTEPALREVPSVE